MRTMGEVPYIDIRGSFIRNMNSEALIFWGSRELGKTLRTN